MILSFDTGTDYDIASKDHVTCWYGLGGGLKGEILPFVSYYLIPILVIFGFKESASQVFDKSPLKDIVVWTALINENVKNKTPSWILTMKRKMVKKHEGETGERWQEREKNLLPRVCDVTI